MIIKDLNNNSINYLPLSVVEGGESAVLTLKIFPESTEEKLESSGAGEFLVLGRIGAGEFLDLSTNPLEVGAWLGASVDVEIKVQSSTPITGLIRQFVFLGNKRGLTAGWKI